MNRGKAFVKLGAWHWGLGTSSTTALQKGGKKPHTHTKPILLLYKYVTDKVEKHPTLLYQGPVFLGQYHSTVYHKTSKNLSHFLHLSFQILLSNSQRREFISPLAYAGVPTASLTFLLLLYIP